MMTDTEAIDFIENVFKSHWPTWQFGDEEIRIWCRTLRRFEYSRAREAIGELYLSQTRQGKPPAGNVRAVLRNKAIVQKSGEAKDNDPVTLFEIVCDGNTRGWRVAASQLSNVVGREQEVINEAERLRNRFCRDGHEYVILYKWEALMSAPRRTREPEPEEHVHDDLLDSQPALGKNEREAARR